MTAAAAAAAGAARTHNSAFNLNKHRLRLQCMRDQGKQAFLRRSLSLPDDDDGC